MSCLCIRQHHCKPVPSACLKVVTLHPSYIHTHTNNLEEYAQQAAISIYEFDYSAVSTVTSEGCASKKWLYNLLGNQLVHAKSGAQGIREDLLVTHTHVNYTPCNYDCISQSGV